MDQILVQKFNDQDHLSASLQLDTETHSLLESNQKSIFRRKITLHDQQQRQKLDATRNDQYQELSNLFEIRFDSSNSIRSAQVGRRIRV
uniref:Uncharacterized protein n=1 Tax=Romanomermis culicivorax TaxID=13658 RepID=A0A915KYE5_ROMCU